MNKWCFEVLFFEVYAILEKKNKKHFGNQKKVFTFALALKNNPSRLGLKLKNNSFRLCSSAGRAIHF